MDEKQKSFINSPFFCSEFQSFSAIVKIIHSVVTSTSYFLNSTASWYKCIAQCMWEALTEGHEGPSKDHESAKHFRMFIYVWRPWTLSLLARRQVFGMIGCV